MAYLISGLIYFVIRLMSTIGFFCFFCSFHDLGDGCAHDRSGRSTTELKHSQLDLRKIMKPTSRRRPLKRRRLKPKTPEGVQHGGFF